MSRADATRDWLVARFPSNKSESPMEALFYAAFAVMRPHLMLPDDLGLQVQQQKVLGRYRADFVFAVKVGDDVKSLVVEVDGHDYHERTKEQAARDKKRDRWMTGEGYQVMRFTGSEVWANPFACACDVADRIHVLRYGRTPAESIAKAGFEHIRKLLED